MGMRNFSWLLLARRAGGTSVDAVNSAASFISAGGSHTCGVTTEGERSALLALSRFVMGAQMEIGDALTELQWRQQAKLQELAARAAGAGSKE